MSDKKNEISEEEMERAQGGAQYSLSAEKTAKRSQMSPTGPGAAEPGPHEDPIRNLEAIRGGAQYSISAEKTAKRSQMSPTNQSQGEEGGSPVGPTVKP